MPPRAVVGRPTGRAAASHRSGRSYRTRRTLQRSSNGVQKRSHVQGSRAGGRRTRRRQEGSRLAPPSAVPDRNQSPRSGPRGSWIQPRQRRPRSGRAASKIDPWALATERANPDSRTTTILPIASGRHPRSILSRPGASRTLRSRVDRRSWRSTNRDLTSTTRSERRAACQPTMSMDPRSPKWLNDHSTSTSQPDRCRIPTSCSTIAAWSRSRSLARSAPRHRTSMTSSAPRARTTDRMVETSIDPNLPSSMSETVDCETPAPAARSTWRLRSSRRISRTVSPTRRSSTAARVAVGTSLPLTPSAPDEETQGIDRYRTIESRPGAVR